MDIGKSSVINALSGNSVRGRLPASGAEKTALADSAANTTTNSNANTNAITKNDTVNISKAAYSLNEQDVKAVDAVTPVAPPSTKEVAKESAQEDNKKIEAKTNGEKSAKGGNQANQLSDDDLKQVQDLKKRDSEVRRHEAAHLAAAGKYATGGASYEYKRGPDGKNYAAGGEVGIDTSPISGDPQATLQKAQQIQAAAQAPANPSSQDRQVAASAAQMASQARQELSGLTATEESPEADQGAEVTGGAAGAEATAGIEATTGTETTEKSNTSNINTSTSATEKLSGYERGNSTNAKAASAYTLIDSIPKSDNAATRSIALVA